MNIQFISAGAGSGKTHRLMEIISAEIAAGCRPEHIMATTFTIKAADEIRSRVEKWFLDKGDFDSAGKASAVNIGTVNSVCGKLVSDFAFEAGLSPDLNVCDQKDAPLILKRVAGTKLDPAVISEFDDLEWSFGIKKAADSMWQEQLGKIINMARSYRIGEQDLGTMGKSNADAMLKVIGLPIVDTDSTLIDLLTASIPAMEKTNAALAKPVGATETYVGLCAEMLEALKAGTTSWDMRVKLEKTEPGKACRKEGEEISALLASWRTHPRFHREVRRYLELLFSSAAAVMGWYTEEKAVTGKMDFTDQEVHLYDLLERDDIRQRVAERLDVLLVDEFQDTSPMQLALFLRLARLAKKTYWIGDVKQAIYGFRGSDSGLMDNILSSFADGEKSVEVLEHSWRSRPLLVNLCNSIFSAAFSGELATGQVVLKPKRPEIAGPHFIRWNLAGSKAEDRLLSLCGGVQKLFAGGMTVVDRDSKNSRAVRWSDIAVLCRTNDTCDAVRLAFRQHGVPLRSAGTGLLATPEVKLLTACLRRLNDREDTLASALILGLSSGLSPEKWLLSRIKTVGTVAKTDLWKWKCFEPDADPILAELENIRPLAVALGPAALLDLVIVRCGIENCMLGWTPEENRARERLSNLDAFRTLVAGYESDSSNPSVSLAGLILSLGEMADGLDELPPSVIDGVTVSTWHGAKGLEWPVVICHESWREIKTGVWKSVKAIPSAAFDIDNPLSGTMIRFWPWPWGAQKNIDGLAWSADPVASALEAQSLREERRLLYVGCTRARDLLIISHPDKNVPGTPGYNCLGPVGMPLFTAPPQISVFTPADASRMQGGSAAATGIRWFDRSGKPETYSPAAILPSAHDEAAGPSMVSVKRLETYAPVLPAVAWAEIREAGIKYHNAFAFFANNPEYTGPEKFPADMRKSILAAVSLIEGIFPDCILHTEVPVNADAGNGQYIAARIDLLVETAEGFHIVDHKLLTGAEKEPAPPVSAYASQLSLYSRAITTKGNKPVLGLWLHFPQRGELVEFTPALPDCLAPPLIAPDR